jgi:hypothetical protein
MGDFVPVKNDRINRWALAASQTIEIGDPVGLTSGRVVKATASTDPILGIAARAVTSSAEDDEMLVFDDPELIFDCVADNAAQVLPTVVGTTCDIVVDSSVFKANLDASVTDVLTVLAIGEFLDPLRDDSVYEGSALAGDWTPGWQSSNKVRCKFAKHALAN